jgi:hypothetical protein
MAAQVLLRLSQEQLQLMLVVEAGRELRQCQLVVVLAVAGMGGPIMLLTHQPQELQILVAVGVLLGIPAVPLAVQA